MLQEFKTFISRGSVIDLAVGIIIGAAFTSIVTSMVNDIVMPVIGVLTSGIDFSNLFIPLKSHPDPLLTLKAAKEAGVPVIGIGVFLNAIINFLIVSFVIFLVVKQVNRLTRKEAADKAAAAPPAPPRSEVLLEEIRDLLAKK